MIFNHFTQFTRNSFVTSTDNISNVFLEDCKSILEEKENLGSLPYKFIIGMDDDMAIISITSEYGMILTTNFICFKKEAHVKLHNKIKEFNKHCRETFTNTAINVKPCYTDVDKLPNENAILYTIVHLGFMAAANPLDVAQIEQSIFKVLYDYYSEKGLV